MVAPGPSNVAAMSVLAVIFTVFPFISIIFLIAFSLVVFPVPAWPRISMLWPLMAISKISCSIFRSFTVVWHPVEFPALCQIVMTNQSAVFIRRVETVDTKSSKRICHQRSRYCTMHWTVQCNLAQQKILLWNKQYISGLYVFLDTVFHGKSVWSYK